MYKDGRATMIYIHALNRGGRGVDSPAGRLDFGPESHWGKPGYANNIWSISSAIRLTPTVAACLASSTILMVT